MSGGLSTAHDSVGRVPRVTTSGEASVREVRELLELGAVDPANPTSEDQFAWISSVSWGPDRRLYVADLRNHHIAVFDSLGRRMETIGRDGEGPGEFGSLFSMAWLDDHLLTMDIRLGRIGIFSPDGEWIAQRPAAGRLTASPVDFRLYQVGPSEVYQWAYQVQDGITEPTWRRVRVEGGGKEWSRATVPMDPLFPDRVVCTMGRGFAWFEHPFAIRTLEHPLPGHRSVLARTDEYQLAILDEARDTLLLIARALDPPRLTDSVWDDVAARYSAWLDDGKDLSACEPQTLHRPDTKPILESLMVDTRGNIWVERNLEVGTLWEVFSEEGELLAAVPGLDHDRERTVPWLAPDRIVWVRRGELDTPLVLMATLHPEVGG